VRLSGSSEMVAQGEARVVDVEINGSGEADLGDLKAREASVDISGSGEATIAPTEAADLDISGSGEVTLLTNPPRLTSDVSGSGTVKREGAADDESKSVTVAEATGMHVGDLDGSKSNNGSTWTATVTVTVHDSGHAGLTSANVTGSWSNGGSAGCTTNGAGTCQVSQSGIRKNVGSVSFSVTGVTHSTLSYNSADNHDPDGDSNGSSITVTKP